jgi:hypothetical protein
VPLAPGDPYAAPRYDEQWQARYAGEQVVPERVVNFEVPGALTVVPVEYFGRDIDRGVIVRAEPRTFERTRPVVEPFSNALLRQASLTTANERRGFSLPPGLAKRVRETQVYASARPDGRRARDGERRAPRVETLPEQPRREKMKFRDERREDVARRPTVAPPVNVGRGERGRLARESEAPRGRGEERREARRAERQEVVRPQEAPRQNEARPERERRGRGAEQHAQGERVGLRPPPPARAARPQQQARPQEQARPQRQHGGPPPQARQQRVEQPRHAPRPQAQQQPRPERERGGGGPPAHAGKSQEKSQGGGKGKGKGRP